MVWLTSLLPLAALLFSTAIPNTPPAAWAFSPTPPQKTVQPSSSLAASSPQVKSSSSWPSSLTPLTPIPPPPPISMPVWSFTCPIPFPRTTSSQSFSSMSILTYVTPVSVSQPKLWALSLYKSTLTRSSFLGIPERNQEYNDIASISSSVTSTSGAGGGMVRRVSGMRGMPDAEGSSGWRVHGSGSAVSKGIGKYIGGWNSNLMGVSVDAGTREAGVGILQLMRPSQKTLVPILGKRSGWEEGLDKREECREMGNDWVPVYGSDKSTTFEVLPNCASYIQVKLKRITDGGDHDVAICEVVGTGVWDEKSQTVVWLSESDVDGLDALDSSTALYTGQLRVEGII